MNQVLRANSGPGRLFGIHARDTALAMKMADRLAERVRGRHAASQNNEARPYHQWLDEPRYARKNRRRDDAHRRLDAHGVALDALHAFGHEPRYRGAWAHRGRE